jgi:nucleoid DNA-binding protein
MSNTKLTKAALITEITKKSPCTKVVVESVLDGLVAVVREQLGAEGPGEVTIPHLVKLKTKATPATQDRQGINPFTKQPALIKGKPASRKVKAAVVKSLKDSVACPSELGHR